MVIEENVYIVTQDRNEYYKVLETLHSRVT